jgi:NAD(P)-dependent dehydrogenase (short-subunit alcohol dehydrogenase family)
VQEDRSVLVLGVGPEEGLGVALCKAFASEGYSVFGCGRSEENMDALNKIKTEKGKITGLVGDVTKEEDVKKIFDAVDKSSKNLSSVIYNAGNNNAKPFLEMDLPFFQDLWEVCAKGAFLVAQQAIPRLVNNNGGSLIFTGATASLRSRPPFTAFASAKSAERSLAQGLAKEFGSKGVHVANVIIDGIIDGDKVNLRFPEFAASKGEDGKLNIAHIADNFLMLHNQKRSTWSFELDLRPWSESW